MAEGYSTVDLDMNGETQDAVSSFRASFTSKEYLGKGSFGSVYKQYDELSKQYIACKEVGLGAVTDTQYQKQVKAAMKEVSAMKRLHHENIVKYYGYKVIQDQHKPEHRVLLIYMEHASGGSVKDCLNKKGAFKETEAKRYTCQMLHGVSYLHRQRIVHRDLKCSNMLLDGNDNIKLADLGIARVCHHSTHESKRTLHTETCGTYHYMAPEVMAGKEYGRKADIWSAGATVVEMLTTHPPWYKLKDFQVMYKIVQQEKPEYVLDSSLGPEVRRFLDVIFNYDSERRPPAEEFLDHDWFSEIIEGETQDADSPFNGETQDADSSFKASFTRIELIGKGCFGKVYKQYDELSKRYIACKEVDLGLVTEAGYEKRVERALKEVNAMKRLDHAHIVKCYGCDLLENEHLPETRVLSIYMEYASGGSVKDRLNKERAFKETQAKIYTWQMLQGVSYLHRQHIIHRDLKCSNMLLDGKDNLKLAGFGIAKELYDHSTYDSLTTVNTASCGTVHYMAPEVLAGEKYGRKADIWSAGATVVEMLTTQPPWSKLPTFHVMYRIIQMSKPEYVLDSSLGPEVRRFLDVIFNYDSKRRPSAEELLGHDWFKDYRITRGDNLVPPHYKMTLDSKEYQLNEEEMREMRKLLSAMRKHQESHQETPTHKKTRGATFNLQ